MISHILTDRQLYDLEMIMNGGFSPLVGFLNKDDYESVVNTTRLSNGKVWPIPITLDISNSLKDQIKIGNKIELLDCFMNKLAYLVVESLYSPDKTNEALNFFGTTDDTHPAVKHLFNES